MIMVKKHAKPARKSPAASKAKSANRKRSGASKTPAKKAGSPAKRPSTKRPAAGTARKSAARSQAAPKASRTPAAAKPKAPLAKSKLLTKPSKMVLGAKPDKAPGKPGAPAAPPVGAKGAATPPRKPSAGEIAARIAGKRAEDAAHKKGRNGKHAEVAPRELTPADVEARKRRLKTLIVLGKERGYLTYAEINDHLPDDILDAEQIEGIISMIGDMGIQVYDEAPDAETLLMSETTPTVPAEDVEEEAEAAASTLDSEFGRTTDPVRMYMREMGSVELLTREGEIEIAKRIEEGLKHMILAISACPMTVQQILELADKI
jgi:RNA polymerase primary sigma factor